MDGSLKPVESDIDSLGLYGDGEAGKFNEEGSFIGQVICTITHGRFPFTTRLFVQSIPVISFKLLAIHRPSFVLKFFPDFDPFCFDLV